MDADATGPIDVTREPADPELTASHDVDASTVVRPSRSDGPPQPVPEPEIELLREHTHETVMATYGRGARQAAVRPELPGLPGTDRTSGPAARAASAARPPAAAHGRDGAAGPRRGARPQAGPGPPPRATPTWWRSRRRPASSPGCTCRSSSTDGWSSATTSVLAVAPPSRCPAGPPNGCGSTEPHVLEPDAGCHWPTSTRSPTR